MTDTKQPMPMSASSSSAPSSRSAIDAATNAYMRRMIGEKLGQHLGADAPMPERLQRLLDQLRLQDQNER